MPPWTIDGQLEATDERSAASLAEYRVELAFTRRTEPSAGLRDYRAASTEVVEDAVSTQTDSGGGFELTLPDESELVGPAVVATVSAPSGRTVAEGKIRLADLREPITIHVHALDQVAVATPANGDRASTVHLSGQLIDPTGNPVPAGLQLTIVAKREGDDARHAILATHVDRSGMFFGDVPNEKYADVAALVPGVKAELPVPLENSRIASRILLSAEMPRNGASPSLEEDCGCKQALPRTPTQADIASARETYSVDLGAGECIDFNTPNRAIEEFDFYTVVRTTEPHVRPLTLPEVDRTLQAAPAPAPAPVPGPAPVTNGPGPLIAVRYDVQLETREFDDLGIVRITFVTDADERAVVFERSVKLALDHHLVGLDPAVRAGLSAALAMNPETGFAAVETSKRSFTVDEDEGDFDAADLDLRSIRHVEIASEENGSGLPWALVGIGISATTDTGADVPILINGVGVYRKDHSRSIHVFTATTAALPWEAPARIEERRVPVTLRQAATAAGGRDVERLDTGLHGPEMREALREAVLGPAVRSNLSTDKLVDWESTPTLHEATTVAHGHLLHFKQVWYADGYSLGDLLYSLPLAPGQKKLISVTDWERRERTDRTEATTAREGLSAFAARDRDLGEVVTGALTESVKGGSRNTTTGVGVGTGAAGNGSYQGFNFGALLGVSGGYGDSVSDAWQDSGRALSTNSMQALRDRTLQSASAVRSLRSSVVQTVSQGESTRVTTEVVANHNHCHALTIQYFEVLRHLAVTHELSDVRECLFVPLPIEAFDLPKILRWRQSLETYLTRPELAPGFDAVRRVVTNWSEVDYPTNRYADEQVDTISGELELTVVIPLPPLPQPPKPRPEDTALQTLDAVKEATNPTTGFLGVITAIATGGASLIANQVTGAAEKATKATIEGARAMAEELLAQESPEAQYGKFQHEVMPGVALGFVDQLQLWARVNGTPQIIASDFTLVSEYRPGVPLLVSVKARLPAGVPRGKITELRIKSKNALPPGCRAIVNTATFRYATSLFEHALVDDRRANDDIDLPVVQVSFDDTLAGFKVTPVAAGDGASLSTPLDAWEQRNPRTEDRRLAVTLVDHLNEQLEFYHHAIWWTMDPNRRYMLLDGYYAPNSGDRSIASVVENKLIGIVGNSLVLPVADGVHLDPRIKAPPPAATNGHKKPLNPLTALYPVEPVPPARVSLPTRGVFAEAVMGSCNACESIDESKFWRWEESPIDEPPAIEAASTATRRTEPADAKPTGFPTPLVSIQTPDDVPDPTGLAAALSALGKQSFADITGLAGTQANAAAAYSKALDTALGFGKEASTLAQQAAVLGARDRTLAAIDKAEAENKIPPEEAKRLRTETLERSIGASTGTPKTSDVNEKLGTILKAQDHGAVDPPAAKRLSETVLRSYVEGSDEPSAERAAGALIDELPPARVTDVETAGTRVQTAAGVEPAGLRVSTAGGPAIRDGYPGLDPALRAPEVDRHCCTIFPGGAMGLFRTHYLGPEDLGKHRYGSGGFNPADPVGQLYAASGGFLDLAHIRDLADTARFIAAKAHASQRAGGSLPMRPEGGTRTITFNATSSTQADVELAGFVGARAAYQLAIWHEIVSWFTKQRYSTFSPEDNFSNLAGAWIGASAAVSRGVAYNDSVDEILRSFVESVGGQPRSVALEAIENVTGLWFDPENDVTSGVIGGPSAAGDFLWRRHMEPWPSVTPWLVTELHGQTFNYADPVAGTVTKTIDFDLGTPPPDPRVLFAPQFTSSGVDVADYYSIDIEVDTNVVPAEVLPVGHTKVTGDELMSVVGRVRDKVLELHPNGDSPL